MKKNIIGWEVFYIADLYDVGRTNYSRYMHGTRAKARAHMRKLKSQPWTFKNVHMYRVSNTNEGHVIWEGAR